MICGLSGGVDSAVAAALVHKAIGDQLTCVFVDTGLLRLDEAEQVEDTFRRQFNVDLVHVKAGDRFLGALDDVVEPERKRKIIGETFIRVFEEVARELRRRRVPRAGHALPGHRRVGRRRQRGDQEPPQRRRPARGHGLRARRAAAPPVQGRGARGRRGARPARGDRLAPAVPRSRARRADHRHDHARAGRDPAGAPTRSSSRRSGAPACTARSGRASRCCPRCAPSACMGDDRTYAYPIIIRAVTSDDAMTADWARLPVRGARAHLVAGDQRGPGREPRRLRRHVASPPAPSSGSRRPAHPPSCRAQSVSRRISTTTGENRRSSRVGATPIGRPAERGRFAVPVGAPSSVAGCGRWSSG